MDASYSHIPIVDKIENILCVACLCVGRALTNLTDESTKTFYLDTIREIPLCDKREISLDICWECDAVFKKIISFREQVKDCYRILQTYNNENLGEYLLTDACRPPRLKVHKLETIDLTPDPETDLAIDKLASVKSSPNEMQYLFIKDEFNELWPNDASKDVKREVPNSNSDLDCQFQSDDHIETEMGMKEFVGVRERKRKKRKVEKENGIRKKKAIKGLQKKSKLVQKKKPEQKIIRTIELSYEEMLAERARDALREQYLRAEHRCEECLLGFKMERSYTDHVAAKHAPGLGEYSCPICKTVIASVESFTAHYKRHLRRYECSACGKRTMDRRVMSQHYATAHGAGDTKQYKCTLCGKVSNSWDAHRYHRGTHSSRVACPDCDKTFSHRAGLMNHRLTVHKLNNAFPCPVCSKVFRWKSSMKKHLELHDSKDKATDALPYCTPCGVTFSRISTYQRHLKHSLKHVTENEFKFICADCNRKFANKTKLRDHIEEKHLHKTYHCDICLKPSKNRVCLDQHIRNVHKGRPNNKICHHCGKGFPTKVQLESHIRSHTGERPYICEFCPTTFSQQSNLYKHNRQVHMNIKAKRYPMCRKRKEGPDPSEEQAVGVEPPGLIHVVRYDVI